VHVEEDDIIWLHACDEFRLDMLHAFLQFQISCDDMLLNDNQLSGEVPPALGAFPIRGVILK
jgi:hypothetical protein